MRTDGESVMTKLMVVLGNFATVPKQHRQERQYVQFWGHHKSKRCTAVRWRIQLHSSSSSSSSSSIGTTAHCGLWPLEQYPSIFSYLPPTLSIFSLPALEDLFLLPLSIFSCVFPFFLSLPVLEQISFWGSYAPPLFLGDLTSLSFALLSILLYFLLCLSLLVLDSPNFSILRFHIQHHIFF